VEQTVHGGGKRKQAGNDAFVASRQVFAADAEFGKKLPGKAFIGGIALKPGTYNITVNFYSGNTIVSKNEYNNYSVREKGLNLIDAISLK